MKTANKKSFAHTLISTALISVLSISPAFANAQENDWQENSQQEQIAKNKDAQLNEEIGFGTGMIIGAIFGGPAGAFITGLAGNFIAKNLNAEDEIETLSVAYQEEKQSNETALVAYQTKIANTEQAYQRQLLALEKNYQATSLLQAQNLLMSLQFSTGSSEIKDHYQEQLTALVSIVKQSPELTIDLSGYTDKQGSDELNQALSLARINTVKNALIDQGVRAERISLYAFGEQHPVVASNDKEVSFYDRRVVIKLKNEAVVSTPMSDDSAQMAKNF
jgi:sortase system peptidoglycan-associated protein